MTEKWETAVKVVTTATAQKLRGNCTEPGEERGMLEAAQTSSAPQWDLWDPKSRYGQSLGNGIWWLGDQHRRTAGAQSQRRRKSVGWGRHLLRGPLGGYQRLTSAARPQTRHISPHAAWKAFDFFLPFHKLETGSFSINCNDIWIRHRALTRWPQDSRAGGLALLG